MIGLTACSAEEYESVEHQHLKEQGFVIKDSGLLPSDGSKVKPESTSIEGFFGKKYDCMGPILYCDEASINSYE